MKKIAIGLCLFPLLMTVDTTSGLIAFVIVSAIGINEIKKGRAV